MQWTKLLDKEIKPLLKIKKEFINLKRNLNNYKNLNMYLIIKLSSLKEILVQDKYIYFYQEKLNKLK